MSYGWRVGARALIAAVSLLVIIASGAAWVAFTGFTASAPHGAPVPALAAGEKDVDGAGENILLIGDDTRAGATVAELKALHAGRDQTTVNADTMMLLHIPADGSAPTLVSFPRDSWVTVPGHGKSKINSAYPDGYNAARAHHADERRAESAGIIETIRTIHALTGLHVDHYVQVNLLGFYRISEAIGGVQVCLLHAQNRNTEVDGSRHGFSGINLPAGVSTIKGAMALAFVRQRHGLPHGDLDRIRRQQYFLEAAFKKIASAGTLLNPFKLHDLLDAVSSSLLTDPGLDLLSLARSFELVAAGSIAFQTLPNNGAQLIYPDGVETSIVGVDHAAVPAFIDSIIGAGPDLSKVKAARPASVTLDVLNGTEVSRLATRNSIVLRRLGFTVDTVDSTPSTNTATVVQYPAGRAAAAKAVANVVPGARLVETSAVARVTLVLGTDGKQVKGLARKSTTAGKRAKPAADTRANGLGCID